MATLNIEPKKLITESKDMHLMIETSVKIVSTLFSLPYASMSDIPRDSMHKLLQNRNS